MQMKYDTGPQNSHQYYVGCGYHCGHGNYCGQGGRGEKRRGNWQGGRGGHVNRGITY